MSEAARLSAQRPFCPLAFCEAPNRSLAPADGLLHETLDPHRRVVNGGRQANAATPTVAATTPGRGVSRGRDCHRVTSLPDDVPAVPTAE